MKLVNNATVLCAVLGIGVLTTSGCSAGVAQARYSAPPGNTVQAPPTSEEVASATVTQAASTPFPTDTVYVAGPGDIAPWDTLTAPTVATFTPAELYAAYRTDPVAADAKYYGKTYTFKSIVIDEMVLLYKGMAEPGEAWVMSGGIYFRTENKSRIMNLKVGDVIDVTGAVMGAVLEHCSYTLIDDTNGVVRPNWVDIPG